MQSYESVGEGVVSALPNQQFKVRYERINLDAQYRSFNRKFRGTAMIMLDEMLDAFFNVLAHRIGVRILKALSGGRFKGERGFAWGWALVVGGVALLAPFVAVIAWLIISRSSG
jgi:hypothetical protein